MIRCVLFISPSGIPLYHRLFVSDIDDPSKTAPLMRALIERSKYSVGLPLSYIELESFAVSFASHPSSLITCALFHDVEDGPYFAKILATHLADEFCSLYPDLSIGDGTSFEAFEARLPHIIATCLNPLLDDLKRRLPGADISLVSTISSSTICVPHGGPGLPEQMIQALIDAALTSDDLLTAISDHPDIMVFNLSGILLVMARATIYLPATAASLPLPSSHWLVAVSEMESLSQMAGVIQDGAWALHSMSRSYEDMLAFI